MPQQVVDLSSNREEIITGVAKSLSRSPQRTLVFRQIYFGKKNAKSVTELMKLTDLPRKRILEEGIKLVKSQIIKQVRVDEEIGYEKLSHIAAHKEQILRLTETPSKISQIATKRNPMPREIIQVKLPRDRTKTEHITIDDIDLVFP